MLWDLVPNFYVQWTRLLTKTGRWKEFDPAGDSNAPMKELKDKKLELSAAENYRRELEDAKNYQSDDPRKRRNPLGQL